MDVSSATLSCPIRINGDFRVTSRLSINGCARIIVDGNVNFQNSDPGAFGITVNFDLDDLGAPVSGEQIPWLMGRVVTGQIGSWNAQNIWDSTNSVTFSNSLCTNTYVWTFSPPGRPGGCGGSRAEGADDSTYNGDEFGDAAIGDWGDTSDLGEMNDFGDLAVGDFGDEFFDEQSFDAIGDVSDQIFDDPSFAVGDDSTFRGDVSDQIFDDQGFFAVDEDGNFLPDVDSGEFDDSSNAIGDLDNFVDYAISPDPNTNTNTNVTNAAPTYAYVLFAIAVLLLIALIVVQVQLVLIQRARAESRV